MALFILPILGIAITRLPLRMPEGSAAWALACSEYGERFVCAVRHGNCVATQFHPEKSGTVPGSPRWVTHGYKMFKILQDVTIIHINVAMIR